MTWRRSKRWAFRRRRPMVFHLSVRPLITCAGRRGAKARSVEVLCELFPKADLYTLLHVKGTVSTAIEKHPIYTSFIQRLPFLATHYRYYLHIFPPAIESFDLRRYDLMIGSSRSLGIAKTRPKQGDHSWRWVWR